MTTGELLAVVPWKDIGVGLQYVFVTCAVMSLLCMLLPSWLRGYYSIFYVQRSIAFALTAIAIKWVSTG